MQSNQDPNQMTPAIFAFNTEYSQPVSSTPLQFTNVSVKPESNNMHTKRKLSESTEDFMVDSTPSKQILNYFN